jgi:predicted GIY-YIG superfamily endonuclease
MSAEALAKAGCSFIFESMLPESSTYYVYIIVSIGDPTRRYVGYTNNVEARLAKHNKGDVISTRMHRPWRYQTYLAFDDKDKALKFERYLKSGSGRAFANKRF